LEIADGEIRRAKTAIMSWSEACQKDAADTITVAAKTMMRPAKPILARAQPRAHSSWIFKSMLETGIIRVQRVVAIQACGSVVPAARRLRARSSAASFKASALRSLRNKLLDRQTGAMVNPNLEMYKIFGHG